MDALELGRRCERSHGYHTWSPCMRMRSPIGAPRMHAADGSPFGSLDGKHISESRRTVPASLEGDTFLSLSSFPLIHHFVERFANSLSTDKLPLEGLTDTFQKGPASQIRRRESETSLHVKGGAVWCVHEHVLARSLCPSTTLTETLLTFALPSFFLFLSSTPDTFQSPCILTGYPQSHQAQSIHPRSQPFVTQRWVSPTPHSCTCPSPPPPHRRLRFRASANTSRVVTYASLTHRLR